MEDHFTSKHTVYSGYSVQVYFFLTEELNGEQEETWLLFFPKRSKYFEISSVDSLDFLVTVDFYPERYFVEVGNMYDMESVVQEMIEYLDTAIAAILERRFDKNADDNSN